MDHTKTIKKFLLLSIIGLIVGFVFSFPVSIGICDQEARFNCVHPLITIGQPLVVGSATLSLVFLFLLFSLERTYNLWKKFAKIYLPIALIFIILSPRSCDFICFDKVIATTWLSGIYLITSLGIITFQHFKHKKRSLSP